MSSEYEKCLAEIGPAALDVLTGLEVVARQLDPPAIPILKDRLRPYTERLESLVPAFRDAEAPGGLEGFHSRFLEGAETAAAAARTFVDPSPPELGIQSVLRSMKQHAMALECFYGLHRFPPLSRFFVEPAFHGDIARLDPDGPAPAPGVGLHHSGDPGARGHFCLYIPEHYDGGSDWPLVVALHGGAGNGRGFLWTWLREARGRGFFLLAPTARGDTWALGGADVDAQPLRAMVEYVSQHWRVDSQHVLLTGLSDGATYALLAGLGEDSPFTALAPVSGVFHPVNKVNGNLARAAGKRIYLVHGARDWMFPVHTARQAAEELGAAGADIVYRELEDLSHTYPREENDRILSWFDPSLALPSASG
jgi:phospholipase/carboxylesterase